MIHFLSFPFSLVAQAIPPDDSQLLQRVLEDALSKLDLLENMQSLQDNSSTDELSQRIGVSLFPESYPTILVHPPAR